MELEKKFKKILCYKKGRHSQKTVKKIYLKWREYQLPSIPERCDTQECKFHTNPCIWNGKKLNLILDHKDGVSGNNRAKNLQLLCPNCNSQQLTHGGKNKGKVEMNEGGYSIKRSDGKKDYILPAEPGEYSWVGSKANLKKKKKKK